MWTQCLPRWSCVNHLTIQDVLRINRFRLGVWHRCLVDMCPVNAAVSELPAEALNEVHATLRLVTSRVHREMAERLLCLWVGLRTHDSDGHNVRFVNIVDSLGAALTAALEEENAPGVSRALRSVPLPPPGTMNGSDGLVASMVLNEIGEGGSNAAPRYKHQCLFASCTAGEDEVIRVVLSIYVRRGRLPEPGEVLFCSSDTTNEELELVVRRFADRRKCHQWSVPTTAAELPVSGDEGIFVVADAHRLDYSSQALLLGHLRSKVLECRDDSDREEVGRRTGGALFLVVSGKPRQAILSWLSDHVVEVPPLPTDILEQALAIALKDHYQGAKDGY